MNIYKYSIYYALLICISTGTYELIGQGQASKVAAPQVEDKSTQQLLAALAYLRKQEMQILQDLKGMASSPQQFAQLVKEDERLHDTQYQINAIHQELKKRGQEQVSSTKTAT